MDDELLMTFMKLHLGLLVNDLDQRFEISAATVSRITTALSNFLLLNFVFQLFNHLYNIFLSLSQKLSSFSLQQSLIYYRLHGVFY